jgi:aspartyl-tRNA synthetase
VTSQKRVFAVMGLGEQEAQEKFGFLLDAFQYGRAPARWHIAFGWDRIVALLSRSDTIPRRDRVPEERSRLRSAHRSGRRDHQADQRREAGVDAPLERSKSRD